MAKTGKEQRRLARLSMICLALPESNASGEQQPVRSLLQGRSGRKRAARDPGRFFVPPYIGPKGWFGLDLDAAEIDWKEIERAARAD